jgi:hypothetical protein
MEIMIVGVPIAPRVTTVHQALGLSHGYVHRSLDDFDGIDLVSPFLSELAEKNLQTQARSQLFTCSVYPSAELFA